MTNNPDNSIKICIGLWIVCLLIFLVELLRINNLQEQTMQKLMPDCTYLGSPRNLNDLGYFDCNVTILIKRLTK